MQSQKTYREASLGVASVLWLVTILLDSWIGWTVFYVASGYRTVDLNDHLLGLGLFVVWAGIVRWIMLWRHIHCAKDSSFTSNSLIGLSLVVGLVSVWALYLGYSFAEIFLTSFIWIMVGGALFGLLTGYLLDSTIGNS